MDNKEKEIEGFKKAMGEPFAIDFSDYTRKVRNNLMFFSVMSLTLLHLNIEIDVKNSSILGLKFIDSGLSMETIFSLLLMLTAYFLMHFIWLSHDHLMEWWIKLTGIHRKVHFNGLGDMGIDNPDDLRQSTLYYWWQEQASVERPFRELSNQITDAIDEYQRAIPKQAQMNDHYLKLLNDQLSKHNSHIESLFNILNSARIHESLKRFDDVFFHFRSSQNLRWLFIEMLLPVLIGIISIIELYGKVWG